MTKFTFWGVEAMVSASINSFNPHQPYEVLFSRIIKQILNNYTIAFNHFCPGNIARGLWRGFKESEGIKSPRSEIIQCVMEA